MAVIEDINTNSVRMGLNCVKGVGETSVDEIIKAQSDGPFKSIQDFYNRVEGGGKNKKNVEACIAIGAFEGIPLEIPKEEINDDMLKVLERIKPLKTNSYKHHNKLRKTDDELNYYIFMDRFKQEIWFKYYIESIDKKPEKNYAIDINYITQQQRDDFNIKFDKGNAFDEMIRAISKDKYVPETEEQITAANYVKSNAGIILSNVEDTRKIISKRLTKVKFEKEIQINLSELKEKIKSLKDKLKAYKTMHKQFELKFKKSLEHYIIAKESQLGLFNLTPESKYIYPVKVKPTGVLTEQKRGQVNHFIEAFFNHFGEIAYEVEPLYKAYIKDINRFEISFIPHPALSHNTSGEIPIEEAFDGQRLSYIGIVNEITKKPTKNGKSFMYNIWFLTKFGTIKIYAWKNMYADNEGHRNGKYLSLFEEGSLLKIIGTKSFGGISAKDLEIEPFDEKDSKGEDE